MYINGVDYYFFSGVKSIFRNKLEDKDIDNKDIIFALKIKNFPFKSISKVINGKEKVIGIYNKYIINSYFDTKEKRDEIKNIIEKSHEEEVMDIVSQMINNKTFGDPERTKSDNRKAMIDYLDRAHDEEMDKASHELLVNDDVMYESKGEMLSDVETEWKPKKGLFLSKSPNYIAKYLLDHSKDKGQAMKRLTFYMNRAGENLSNKTVLNKAKEILREKD